ncbi:non-SMC mitotic condensation complex subunit 1 [Lactifluus volemus]|nr:non-SMC mitotic condensation complex subunit 1 [Lactifluus volemus]
MDALLQQAVRAIAESFEAVTFPNTFDILCSFLKCVDAVPGILMNKLLDVIMSGFAAEVDAAAHDIDHEDQQTCAAHKVPMEMYTFLLNWSARSVEKVNVPDEDASAAAVPTKSRKGKATQSRVAFKNKAAECSWKDQIVPILTLIAEVLQLKTSKIWTVMWGEGYFYRILREIAAKSFNAQDTKGPRNFSRFLTQFAEWAPRAVLKQIRLLLSHLDSESYPMRMAIVEIIGCLICELACSEDRTNDAHQMQKQLDGLYDLLLERTLDLSSYPTLRPPREISQTAPRHHTCGGVYKVAGVCRNGIWLIIKLMVTHPYGLTHGGLLWMKEWEDRYREVASKKNTEGVMDVDEEDGDEGGDLDKVDIRLDMDSPVFRKLQEAIEHPCRSREWFALTEQTINTLFVLGDQPEVLIDTLMKDLSRRAFRRRERPVPSAAEEQVSFAVPDEDAMDEDPPPSAQAPISIVPGSTQGALTGNTAKKNDDTGDAFYGSRRGQAHCLLGTRRTGMEAPETGKGTRSQGVPETTLRVAGNAEDEIGDRIAAVRETRLLYGPDSLLALYGPLLVRICGRPDQFKNTTLRAVATLLFSESLCVSSQFCDANHYLLFRILETSRDPNIRSNIAIALEWFLVPPLVISHLSVGEYTMDEEEFQRRREHRRKALSAVPAHRRYPPVAGHCILSVAAAVKPERSVEKLIEGLPFYRDKLHEKRSILVSKTS